MNKDNLKESIEYHIKKLVNNIQKYKSDLKDTEDKIEALQNKLSEQQGLLLDQEGRRKYYNNLIDILEKSISVEKPGDEQKIESKNEQKIETPTITPEIKEDIRKLLNIDENTSKELNFPRIWLTISIQMRDSSSTGFRDQTPSQ